MIVNYKTPQLLVDCIASIYQYSTGFTFEIIVVDNHSQDDSQERILELFPEVIWHNLASNSGFSVANNVGMSLAKGSYYLLLNSDTECYENCIYKTLQYYKKLEETTKVGLVGCRIESKDYSLQPSCNYYFPGIIDALQANPLVILFWKRWLKRNILKDISQYDRLRETHQVVWLGMPYALINAKICRQKKDQLDEDFFMYAEDKEWNFRLSKNGYKHFYYAETGIFHVNGGSGEFQEKRERQIIVSDWLYVLKSRGRLLYLLYLIILGFNLFFDSLLHVQAKMFRKNFKSDLEQARYRKLTYLLIRQFGLYIFFNFRRKTSSSRKQLNSYGLPI